MTSPSSPWIGEILTRSQEYAVIALALDGRITGWHGAAPRLFGYVRDEIVGQPFAVLFEPDDVHNGIPHMELELARRHGRSEDDRWHRRRDGSRFWANGVLSQHLEPGGELVGYVKLMRDRTDIRIRDEALHNRVRSLTQQLTAQRVGLRTLVHELRNSIGPLLNASRVAASASDDALRVRMHDVVMRQIEVIQRVLQSAAEQPEAERLRVQPVVLQDALRTAVDAMQPEARAKAQTLMLVCPEAPITLEVDAPRLQQMVLNLVSNAVKYTPAGGHIAVSGGVEGEMAVIRVDDDGVGIASENLERVFDLFTREADHDAVPGFGIGLAVVKRLAWLHGGFVQARSPGKGMGSQFALQLPLRQAAR